MGFVYRFDETRTPRATVIRKAGARGPFPPFTPPGLFPAGSVHRMISEAGVSLDKDRSEPHDGRNLPSMKIPMGELTSLAPLIKPAGRKLTRRRQAPLVHP